MLDESERPIPPGCHWSWHNWIQPTGVIIPRKRLRVIQDLAGLEDLHYSLERFIVRMRHHLRAEAMLKRAVRRLRTADARREYLPLPEPPWLIDGVVVARKGDHYSVFTPTDPTVPWRRSKTGR
jgi:hypothetical protein